MAKQTNLLNDIQLKQWMQAGEPVAKSDGDGLTFTLSAAGTATWVLRFRHGGRRHELTLGRYPDVTLREARKTAAEKRVNVQQGRNPAVEVRKAKARKDWSVRQLVDDYRTLVLDTLSASTQATYGRSLKRIEHGMGAMSVRDVEPADIVAQLERSKVGWVEAKSLLTTLKGVFRHAAGKKIINSNPVIGVELTAVMGARPETRKRLMLTEKELRVLLNAELSPENLLTVRILLGTGVRGSELYTATRTNVHLDEARWHLPKSKMGPEMDIPLAPIVVKWFRQLMDLSVNSAYVLPARARSRAMKQGRDAYIHKDTVRMAIDFWLDNSGPDIRRFTPHDLRSTMKSHMRSLGVSRDISEMCLNHKLKGVEGVYDVHSYYPERRAALELWASFLATCQAGKEWKVRPLRKSAA
ncbi:tyrosine-type recombinase/integrase [Paraburkholderia sediminicola]|uniref:tyrosine-type recombinase/integrase n=1 Tax=Paraburkholderia sediminicola TaxID=458836 RepID=UPI0038B93581